MIKHKPEVSGVPEQSQSVNPASSEISLDREGIRHLREGFPAVSAQQFDMNLWRERRQQLEGILDNRISSKVLSLQNRVVTLEDYRSFGMVALDHMRELAGSLNGVRPTFYQIVARLSFDPDVGPVGSPALERAVRMLHGRWFSGGPEGSLFWTGSSKNLFDGMTVKLDSGAGAYAGMTVAEAMIRYLERHPSRLFTSTEIAQEFNLAGQERVSSGLLAPVMQLLAHASLVTRHPDHLCRLGGKEGKMVAVWSDRSGQWRKPSLLNPEQVVLAHAAGVADSGWMFQLYADTGGGKSIFSHHAVKGAAERLATRGMVHLTSEFMPEHLLRPSGDRAYARVRLTDTAENLVRPWQQVPEGALLTRANYDDLRLLLVEQRAIASLKK